MNAIFGLIDLEQRPHYDALETLATTLQHRGGSRSRFLSWSPGSLLRSADNATLCGPSTVVIGNNYTEIGNQADGRGQRAQSIMSSHDDRLQITFDGILHNKMELQSQLSHHYNFASQADAEVVLAAWDIWGAECLNRFIGTFALCLVDSAEKKARLIIDHFGAKPLFWTRHERVTVFASELPALIKAGFSQRVIAPKPLYDFLIHGLLDHSEETMVNGIQRVRPGHIVELDLTRPETVRVEPYWAVPSEREDRPFEKTVADITTRFQHSMERNLQADGQIAALLSGGIDSSSIVCSMRQILGPNRAIHTFSYIPDDERLSEDRWIDLVNDYVGAIGHKVRVSTEELIESIDDFILSQGEPVAGPSPFAQRQVFKAASELGFDVVLDGQGADELFGGYKRHLSSQFLALLKSGRLVAAGKTARGVISQSDMKPARAQMKEMLASVLPPRWTARLAQPNTSTKSFSWLNNEWFIDQYVEQYGRTIDDSLNEALSDAFSRTSLPVLLRYEDRNTTRFSIEGRVPFLDQDLVNNAFTYPQDTIIDSHGVTKAALRSAMQGTVPHEILARRDKIGFSTPQLRWFVQMSPWVELILTSTAMERVPALVAAECLHDWRRMKSGAIAFDWRFWRWLITARWAELLDLGSSD